MSFCRHHFFITSSCVDDWLLCMRYGKSYIVLVRSRSRYKLSILRKDLQSLWELNGK